MILTWNIYTVIAVLAIVGQLLFLLLTWNNYGYSMKKSAVSHSDFTLFTLLTVPCKGIDNSFEKNITSLFMLDYSNFVLHFVVEDTADPAYQRLCDLKDKLSSQSKAQQVSILVAGKATGCSQKIHNLLHSCRHAPEGVEVFAFADSDACLKPTWLGHIVYPLRKEHYGASTGYRWFVPEANNLATLGLSALNAKIAQMLGNTHFNQLWGGSMAVRAETFRKIDLESVWEKAISDDLSLSYAIKKAGKKIIFSPGCMVASYETTTWGKLFEFTRRQFVITRVTIPGTWWFAVFCIVYSLAGLWGTAAVAIYAAMTHHALFPLYASVPILFFTAQMFRAILRQKMIAQLLPEDAVKMRPAAIADIFGTFFWSWVLLVCIVSSGFGRIIKWRGISYKLISPTETIILPDRK